MNNEDKMAFAEALKIEREGVWEICTASFRRGFVSGLKHAKGGEAVAWAEGYMTGVQDERISESNIGIAGFGAKVNPARVNPYKAEQIKQSWPQWKQDYEFTKTPATQINNWNKE